MSEAPDLIYPQYAKTFREMAWKDFDFLSVVEVLLDERPSFPHHKAVLFSALGTWVIAPGGKKPARSIPQGARTAPPDKDRERQNSVRNAIRMSVRMAVSRYERKVIQKKINYRAKYDLAARQSDLGPEFISQVYYGIGGIASLRTPSGTKARRESLREDYGKTADTFVKIFQCAHHFALLGGEPKVQRPPSLQSYYRLLDSLNELYREPEDAREKRSGKKPKLRYLQSDALQKKFYQYRDNAVLLYAASLVHLGGGGTLLDRFFSPIGERPERSRREVLVEWLSYAAFLEDRVLYAIPSGDLGVSKGIQSLGLKPQSPPPPSFPEAEQDIVKNFAEHRSSIENENEQD